MNRAEKRKMDRLEQWFNSLSEDKKQMIYGIINDKIESNNNMMNAISDICTVGALDDVLDISISDIKDVIVKTKEYLVDYGEYLEREKDGGIEMIENQELKNEVKNKIRQYISGKIDKARGLKLLKNEFNLPNAELSDLWLECKVYNEGYGKSKNLPNLDQNIENKDVEKTIKPEKSINLRVVKITKEILGEYGTYIKSDDCVKIGDNIYDNIDVVRKKKKNLSLKYKIKINNIKNQINKLNTELMEVQDLGMKEIEKFTELELVFGL